MSQSNIALIDYGSGNLRSVEKALQQAGAHVFRADSPRALDSADALVVPGVGAFGDAVTSLRTAGLWNPIKCWLQEGRPYLGICLGYQLLFDGSEESPSLPGLGIIPGRVKRFPKSQLKVPHMGWNELHGLRGPLFGRLDRPSVYFVHSYYPLPDRPDCISAWCDYGVRFAAAVSLGAVHATQFHPEKSQAVGRIILESYLESLEK